MSSPRVRRQSSPRSISRLPPDNDDLDDEIARVLTWTGGCSLWWISYDLLGHGLSMRRSMYDADEKRLWGRVRSMTRAGFIWFDHEKKMWRLSKGGTE